MNKNLELSSCCWIISKLATPGSSKLFSTFSTDADLNSFIFWGLHQNLEFRINPYSIYDKYQNIDKTMTFESFNFGNVLRCYKEDTKNEDFYKIVGVVSQKQEQ